MPSVHSCELDDRGGVLVRPNPAAATFIDVSTPAPARPARARLGRWPFDDAVVHLVLLDHHMVPTAGDLDDWVRQAHDRGATHVRTGALFPNATAPFLDAGFRVIDTLTLLAADLETTAHLDPAPVAPDRRRCGCVVSVRAMLDGSGNDRPQVVPPPVGQ